ncbi:DUF6017 domain-containing protein [Porcincola intestinalis]|nr:DUF6017 domain-containing protein [Porcincola intestinalis]MCI6767634.1 replication initiator protein A [Lachnospiraceae bacterium]MDD7060506.1 DUF6017 domain-containing protein [Porcincola intestinalis]MDY5282527.1 DUF6017 domain-containing protein [Porcincola intestinalis]
MTKKMTFPFHYGGEAESYTFYRVPKILFTEKVFDHLSTDAKLLYGLLLDRMQLSLKNGWVDENGKVFIYYTVESIMDALTCGNKKAGLLLAELDEKKGIGLISRVRQGLGKPDRIYVHKCVVPEMSFGHIQKCRNDMSGDVPSTGQEMSKRHANKTDRNNTEHSKNDLIVSAEPGWDESAMKERRAYREYFLERCSFEVLKAENHYSAGELDELLELLVDVCCSRQKTIRISGDEKPMAIVKSRFMKLDSEHIRYVLHCFKENTTKVRNIKQYLLASLYNAPMTIGSYYTALVQHDLYGVD